MSRHSGPEYTAPDDIRCEAIVKGHPSYHWEWVRKDHRCPKKANQMRAGYAVCYQHATVKNVEYIGGKNGLQSKS